MIILGIDPGTATTGWGVIKKLRTPEKNKNSFLKLLDFGCILTNSGMEMGDRLVIIRKNLLEIIETHRPDFVVVEKLFFGANSTSAITVGQARGVILLTASEKNIPVFEYTGLQVKLTVADHGRADKQAIQTAVRRHLKISKLPQPKDQRGKPVFRFRDDAYDAVAASICHLIKSNIEI